MKKINEEKAKILYDFLDESKLFKGTVVKKVGWDPAFLFSTTTTASRGADHCWEGAAWERVWTCRREPSVWPLKTVCR